MKVMRVIARLNVGGPALHCLLLSKGLGAEGFETTLVTGSSEDTEAEYQRLFEVETKGFRLVRLKRLQRSVRYWGDLLTLLELIRLMRKERPQIVHTHTAKAGLLGRVAAFVTGVPVVIHTFHGHVLSGYFPKPMSYALRLLEKALAWRTSAIVTLSPSLKQELSQKFKVAAMGKFRIIPLGRELSPFFESDKFRGEFRRELGISDPGTTLFGIIGRLVPIKDHETLFRACATLDPALRWHLAIVGDGDLNEALRKQAEDLGIASKVSFLGWRSDLPRIYVDLDAMLLTSRNEGTPLSIIEAFAASCPVIATSVGGVPDMIRTEEGAAPGRLVPPNDPVSLKAAMESVMRDPEERNAMARQARKRAENYTESALLSRVAALYRELSC